MHGIANDRSEIAKRIIEKAENSIGTTYSNLRPGSPKAPKSNIGALCQQALNK